MVWYEALLTILSFTEISNVQVIRLTDMSNICELLHLMIKYIVTQIKDLLRLCKNFRDMINENTYDKDIRKQIEKANATRNMALTNFAYGIEKD